MLLDYALEASICMEKISAKFLKIPSGTEEAGA
jgi:hypothetical protein